jgi:hypothetical protein
MNCEINAPTIPEEDIISEHFLNDIKKLIENNTKEDNETIIGFIEDRDKNSMNNVSFHHGENLLHWAGAYDNAEICEFLIDKLKVPVDLENSRSATPLYYATMQNSVNSTRVLLKYHADPRVRSGFSGKFPHEITKNDEIKEMLLETEKNVPIDYDNNYSVKEGRTLVQAYNFRLHRYYLSILTASFLKLNKRSSISDINEIKSASKIFKKYSYAEIKSKYEEIQNQYIEGINDNNVDTCLYCRKNIDLKRCSKCKKAYFCDRKCQINANDLHKFDCK